VRLVEGLVQHGTDADRLAVTGRGGSLTYRALVEGAAALADALTRRGVGPEVVVGLATRRSPELIVGMVGVWLAGGAWVPLDPDYPADRLRYLIADAGVRVVVGAGADRLAQVAPVSVVEPTRGPTAAVARSVPAGALAYVIYTSGSTGTPKPVGIPRDAVDHLLTAKVPRYRVERASRVAQFAPASFDVAVAEVVMALGTGATLVLPPDEALVPGPGTTDFLRRERITHLLIAPSVLAAVAPVELPDLRVLGIGGEALPAALAARWGAGDGGRVVLNGYGPTEVTVWASAGPATSATVAPDLGDTFPGVTVHVEPGEVGELVVGGAGLARGYLGRPGLTAQRFVPDPRAEVPGARAYRTGDLVRVDSAGRRHFVGRTDQQVKIRGFRVEPGEISAALRAHDRVTDAVTIAAPSPTGEPRLVSYCVSTEAPADLRAHLAAHLPAHLVPALIVTLDALPVTAHGKVDLAALPDPGPSGPAASSLTEREAQVAEILGELLGVGGLGPYSDFFAAGGHSLLVARLAARLQDETGREIGLADILRGPTVRALAARLEAAPPAGTTRIPHIPPANRDAAIPLSLPQERVWFLEQLAPENLAYNTQVTLRLRGPVRPEILEQALTRIVARHEILRTAFVEIDGRGRQVIHPPMPVHVPVRDVPVADAERAIAEELRRPFDLRHPPLARWALLRHGPGDHTLVQVEHHFVHDGWSFALLMTELVRLYRALDAGEEPDLPPPPMQYADYAQWQRRWMSGAVLQANLDYWTEQLRGAPAVLDLPTDRPRPPAQTFAGRTLRIPLPRDLSRALTEYARASGHSLFATMLAGFAALLHRYTRSEDLLIGTGTANRHTTQLEGVLGMLVNTLVLRLDVRDRPSFAKLVDRAAEATAAAFTWPDVPIDEVIRALDPPRDASRNPLFQVMFSFHDSPVPDFDLGAVRGELTERSNGSAKVDLNVVVVPRGSQRRGRRHDDADEDMTLIWEYASDLFDEPTMAAMVDHYLHLLAAGIADDHLAVGGLPVAAAVPEPAGPGPQAPDVLATIGRHVTGRPHAIAVADDATSLTYAQLWSDAHALAAALTAAGTGIDDRVVLLLPRSAGLVTAMLATVMAGAGYVPLDPALPPARVAQILAQCSPRAILQAGSAGPERPCPVIDVQAAASTGGPATGEPVRAPDSALAYVLFTSGSTGVPKGIEVTRGNLAALAGWGRGLGLSGAGERVSQFSSPAFDASALEIWSALTAGASLLIVPEEVRASPAETVTWLVSAGITTTFVPTALLDAILASPTSARLTVPRVWTGGQALTRAPAPDAPFTLVNLYGPTETACIASGTVVDADAPPTIGRPLSGVRIEVLRDGRAQPPGIPGELAIGGPGVSRGYLGEPGRTAAAFVPDPHGPPGSRRYLTGDLGRRRRDGCLDYLGRLDNQVKLRGFRIELDEVSAVLREHPRVSDAACVLVGDPGAPTLLAYAVATAAPDELRAHLAGRLPAYHVPDRIRLIDHIPLTASGKLDTARLPAPPPDADRDTAHVPLDGTLAEVAAHWERLLQRAPAGPAADFFAAGGHSLLAGRLVASINDELGVHVRLAAFLATPTLAGLAALVDADRAARAAAPEAAGPALPEDLDTLSDAEVAALLSALGQPESGR